MSPTVEIKLTVPEGTTITLVANGAVITDGGSSTDDVERYWGDYLSGNARKVYWAAARIEMDHGPGFTLEDIARRINQSYESVRSFHRTSGRTAKLWRHDHVRDEPIRLIYEDYRWDERNEGMRTFYRLPPGVAEKIDGLAGGKRR